MPVDHGTALLAAHVCKAGALFSVLERPHTARYPPCTSKVMADPPPPGPQQQRSVVLVGGSGPPSQQERSAAGGVGTPPPSSSALLLGGAGISVPTAVRKYG